MRLLLIAQYCAIQKSRHQQQRSRLNAVKARLQLTPVSHIWTPSRFVMGVDDEASRLNCVLVEPMQAVLGGIDRLKYEQFIKHVQTVAQLTYREEAERATRATLETIRDRIVGDEAKDLASQLPAELKQYLQGREGENGQFFSLDEFIKRVSEKEDVEPTHAAIHVRAVFRVLQEAITPGEFADFQANFSEDYAHMFAALSQV